MKLFTALVGCVFLLEICSANEQAMIAGKFHLESFLSSRIDALSNTYNSDVMLMPGHEFLKEGYGLAKSGARDSGQEVSRERLLDTMKKAAAARPERPAERVEKLMASLRNELVETREGEFSTEASDPVGTSDGKLHFSIEKGDVLLKISPPKGDFILLHLREIDGVWKVVSEYLD